MPQGLIRKASFFRSIVRVSFTEVRAFVLRRSHLKKKLEPETRRATIAPIAQKDPNSHTQIIIVVIKSCFTVRTEMWIWTTPTCPNIVYCYCFMCRRRCCCFSIVQNLQAFNGYDLCIYYIQMLYGNDLGARPLDFCGLCSHAKMLPCRKVIRTGVYVISWIRRTHWTH